jgi:hypothetical protein
LSLPPSHGFFRSVESKDEKLATTDSMNRVWTSLVREARFDYLLVDSTEISEPLPIAEALLGRRTLLTFPLLPPPQKN